MRHNGRVSGRDPHAEYQRRLASRRARLDLLGRQDARIAAARLVVFGAGALLLVAVTRGAISSWWLVVPVVAFAGLALRHDVVLRERDRIASAVRFYERGLARIEDHWVGTGATGDRFASADHPYAADLDIFGPGSLFELLSVAQTGAGEATLAAWLLGPASIDEIHARHRALDELAPMLDARERLAVQAKGFRERLGEDALAAWAEAPTALAPWWLRRVATALTAATLSSLAFMLATDDYLPFLVMLAVQSAFAAPQAARTTRALHAADAPARNLALLAPVLEALERERFEAPRLAALQQQISGDGAASTAIRRLQRLVEMHDWQHNAMFVPVALVLLWGTHVAWAIEDWRRRHGRRVAAWLRAVGDLEALASLAAYRYERPADPFPELIDGGGREASYVAADLGHPLLPSATAIRNDVRLGGSARLLIVSGSNMSGKSTLLRAIGLNALLAQCGAPVCAGALRLPYCDVQTSIRITDSLERGVSYFMAALARLKAVVDAAEREPGDRVLLYLLDEILQGTNSAERGTAVQAVARHLLEAGAIGAMTTHDLNIASEEPLLSTAQLVHFSEVIDDSGAMRFDYHLRPGLATSRNAIRLMQLIGIDV